VIQDKLCDALMNEFRRAVFICAVRECDSCIRPAETAQHHELPVLGARQHPAVVQDVVAKNPEIAEDTDL